MPDQKEFQLIIKKLDEVQDTTPVMARIAGMLRDFVEDNFKAEGRPVKWKPLSKKYAARKQRLYNSKSILQLSGDMANTIQESAGRDYAKISSNLAYAAIHHFGGEITSTTKKGKMRKISIPARPYMLITEDDKAELTEEIQNHIRKKLGLQKR
jgi:phage virion morphogenesis protein